MSNLLDKVIKQNPAEDTYFKFKAKEKDQRADWLGQEGELKVDVYYKDDNLVVKSTIAGAKPEDIAINLNNDILTIRGKRNQDERVDEKDHLHHECFWGNFSRSIVLPCEIQKGRIKAILKRGVLTIILPKAVGKKEIKVKELEE